MIDSGQPGANTTFSDELFRDGETARRMISAVRRETEKTGPVKMMEVCGTHTVAFLRSGLRSMLSGSVELVSGPGCPVCVTPNNIIDAAIEYSLEKDFIVATFGDMIRVPGSRSSLEKARADGGDARVVYSASDALRIAAENPCKKIVFMGIGFETTSPTVAAAIVSAKKEGLSNFAVLCAHKLVPPAMEALVADCADIKIKGFICPGHASAIIGAAAYTKIARDFSMPCVVTGFEPLDMLQGIYMLVKQVAEKRSEVEAPYSRVVRMEGNRKALDLISLVFDSADAAWRGIGTIPMSGNVIREEFADFDAEKKWPIQIPPSKETPGCRCAEILTGKMLPSECGLFGSRCSPANPVGPCMVSSEGSCAAHYRYGGAEQ